MTESASAGVKARPIATIQMPALRRREGGIATSPLSLEEFVMSSIFFALATLKARLQDADKERGATAVEYGIMVALIAVVIIGAVFALGGQLGTLFNGVRTDLMNPGGA